MKHQKENPNHFEIIKETLGALFMLGAMKTLAFYARCKNLVQDLKDMVK